ncbi:family 20 glycosylhydrolase [uncultured Bacteroides sp.]|uniref:glycoside hydrolase family 20 protein n=1 Tax=uncultured Bacteroides sp. TaxID=162156 RepID=UPI002AA86759|nr:family 20 glycosylhydrolase [uncultured Bacteroides sp.]
MRKLNHILLFFLAASSMVCQAETKKANYQVIPLPQEVVLTGGNPFVINSSTRILYAKGDKLLQQDAAFLSDYLKEMTGKTTPVVAISKGKQLKNTIVLKIDGSIKNAEGYELTVDENNLVIAGGSANGVFYGVQTVRKSIPVDAQNADVVLPAVKINDSPRFAYRGMMLDVGRHFFPVDFIKRYIDLLALHNMNYFHWHLTEDQGWRIEIKKYPKLTEIGSIRKETVIGKNTGKYDGKPYGGFYTQKEIKEIVAYAQKRFITIVPEIDLPGHMLAALAAYPELGCTGGPYEVSPRWGVFDDVLCIGNEKSMKFIEDVLDELITLFPSKYIHIGGDECPRTRWKQCPKCQARIKAEGLKGDEHHTAEDRLQSYCMQRIEKHLNAKGRRIIGWDEILDGDVAPDATVMSWRGMEGGIKAAQLKHDVIMTPNSYVYFDYYQTTDTQNEPLAIGGFLNVERVYSMEPVPKQLTEEEGKHIIGVQANVWTEYMPTSQQVEYMVLPRMAALAEVQWTQADKKDYRNFTSRLPRLMTIYDQEGYNYAKHIYDIKASFSPLKEQKAIQAELSTIDNAPIYYTLDGSEPNQSSTRYSGPVSITQSVDFTAIAIRKTGKSKPISEKIGFNKATLCPVSLNFEPSKEYRYNGATTLVDGLKGNDSYASGRWLGFIDGNPALTVDMGKPQTMSHVSTEAIVDMDAWIMGVTGISVAVSDDNITFREVATKQFPADTDVTKKDIGHYDVSFSPVEARYVKVTIKGSPALPKGHDGEGKTPYLFIDEVTVE